MDIARESKELNYFWNLFEYFAKSNFIYTKQYQIICPLLCKNQIDLNNFSKDLIINNKTFENFWIFYEKSTILKIKKVMNDSYVHAQHKIN